MQSGMLDMFVERKHGREQVTYDHPLMEEVLKRVKTDWEMHWVEGADHSFHVLKSSGKTDAQVMSEIADAAQAWLRKIKPSR